MSESEFELLTLHFGPGQTIPNNRDLPVLLYRQAKAGGSTDLASWWNQTFSRNGWKGLRPAPYSLEVRVDPFTYRENQASRFLL